MLTAIREVQIPLLAAMLLGAFLAKTWRALRPHAHPARSDPADLFPAHLRRPIMVLVFAAELGLGLGLIGTAVKFGRDWPALPATVRTGTALFFLVAVGALNEMRQRRPDAGCGCFGELSGTPIGLRTIARPGLLCASAVATLGPPPLRMPSSPTRRPGGRSRRGHRRGPGPHRDPRVCRSLGDSRQRARQPDSRIERPGLTGCQLGGLPTRRAGSAGTCRNAER
jgi:hypothetical protein